MHSNSMRTARLLTVCLLGDLDASPGCTPRPPPPMNPSPWMHPDYLPAI